MSVKTREVCRGCAGNGLVEVFDLGQMPLAGGFLANREAIAKEARYPLAVAVCQFCGLVQIIHVVDPEVLFQDYSFSSSTIKPLVDHFTTYAEWIKKELSPDIVVEFGCNDGVLLDPLQKLGIQAIGVDVSKNITELARGKGLDVHTGYFDLEKARLIRDRVGPVDVVTGSNAFAHNDQPELILEAADLLLKDSGYLCLEVMYAGDLLEQLQWDTLYHEHLTFYSLGSLQVLLERFGFSIVKAERLPMHGGSLRICATRVPGAQRAPQVDAIDEYEHRLKLQDVVTWQKFSEDSRHKIRVVKDVFKDIARHKSVWAYGAAGKATFWVNACEMTYLGGVVDASPLRAGKLMPGIHTPIVFPDEFKKANPDYMFVTAWNYADLIREKESWHEGIWAVPLPDLKFF